MAVSTWRFEQLGGERRVLELAGWSAPFGRPRQTPVVRDKLQIRQQSVYYPDSDGPPTRHIFGARYEPWELSGRFMDRERGPGYARAKTREVLEFVRDQQQVRISWGDILSYRGFIESFDPGRESVGEVAWKMSVLVDADDFVAQRPVVPVPAALGESMAVLERALAQAASLDTLPSIRPSVLDALASAVSLVGSATAAVAGIVRQLTSIEQATLGQVQRLRASLGQLRTALLGLRNLIASVPNDVVTVSRSFSSDIEVGGLFARMDVNVMLAAAEAERLDRDASIVERGQLKTRYRAKSGDTWESIATRVYGGPDRADVLRQANGIRYGEPPEPGRSYVVPLAL